MKTPNDIINIIKRLLSGKKIKKCNHEYYKLFHVIANYNIGVNEVWLLYKNNNEFINYRFKKKNNIRKKIVCFLTNKDTNYCIPKNY